MTQNLSSAVMQQRREPHDSLDFFPTPPWATRALCEALEREGECLGLLSCWEPACGEGHMVRPLRERFRSVIATDVHQYGHGDLRDFLLPDPLVGGVDWIITNPPFRLGEAFAETAIGRARRGVALLVRSAFLEGVGRYERLYEQFPPSVILQFTERVPMHKGRLDPHGSTATAYCWVVWLVGNRAPVRFRWIAPCRRRLERDGDYEAAQ